jgi:Tat protein translocase TatC
MTRIYWWLAKGVSRILEANERDAVLGDLAESHESGGQALRDLLGLVVRRQAALWGPPLLRSAAGILVGMALCFYFADSIYNYLARPLTDALHAVGLSSRLVYTDPFDPLRLYIKLSTMCGVFLASPYIAWQIWASMAPSLYRHDKRHLWPFILVTTTLFVGGGLFTWKLTLSLALRLVLSHGFRPMLHDYWNLAMSILLGVGLLFEVPVLWWLVRLKHKAIRSTGSSPI